MHELITQYGILESDSLNVSNSSSWLTIKKFLANTFSIRELATTTVVFSFVYWLNVFINEYSILAPTVKAVFEGNVHGVVVQARK